MGKYNIPLRVKLSKREYDKVKDEKNVSAYVRNAINFYNNNQPREIELNKKKLLTKVMETVEEEEEKSCAKIMKTENLKKEKIMKKLNKMAKKCDEELLRLAEENKDMEDAAFESFDSKPTEEKILSILPTLQGIYNSEIGDSYETISRIGGNINVNPKDLLDWMNDNQDLLRKTDYLYREPIHKKNASKKHEFKYDG